MKIVHVGPASILYGTRRKKNPERLGQGRGIKKHSKVRSESTQVMLSETEGGCWAHSDWMSHPYDTSDNDYGSKAPKISSLSSARQPVRWLFCLALIRKSTFKEMKDFIKDDMIVSSRTNARSRRARLQIPARNFPLHTPATTEWGSTSLVQGFLLKIQSYYDSKCWEELKKAGCRLVWVSFAHLFKGHPLSKGILGGWYPHMLPLLGSLRKLLRERGISCISDQLLVSPGERK